MESKLETFDDEHGEVVLNALSVYAERMREVAQEAQAGAVAPEQPGKGDRVSYTVAYGARPNPARYETHYGRVTSVWPPAAPAMCKIAVENPRAHETRYVTRKLGDVSLASADLRKWGREDLLMLARAAGMLWHSTSREDPLDVLTDRQLTLLDRAAAGYLLSPEQAAEDGETSTISLRPTPGGFAGISRAFTDAANRADAAHKAYEHLTGRDELTDAAAVDEH